MQHSDDLNPIRVLALFSAVSDEDCELLALAGRPEGLVMTHLPVPPACIRPSVEMDTGGGTNEDDITMKLMVGGSLGSFMPLGVQQPHMLLLVDAPKLASQRPHVCLPQGLRCAILPLHPRRSMLLR